MNNLYYLYRHIRLDKDEPFYVGISANRDGCYRRAVDKHHNHLWLKIVEKSSWYAEIMYETTDMKELQEKEKFFIKLYGRIYDGGILANISKGGHIPIDEYMKYRKKFLKIKQNG